MKTGGNNLGGGALARRLRLPPRVTAGRPTRKPRKAAAEASESPASLYERLPRGPHQLGADAVARNQRQRMHGAMIEAVATGGYGRMSVKRVTALAGVSRRAFYEQFANKQECFLATLDLLAAQALAEVDDAYSSSAGPLEDRLGAAFDRFAELVSANPKSSRVLLIDASAAGPPASARLNRTVSAFEQRLAASFAQAPDAAELPAPIVRAIVGGLRLVTVNRLLEDRADELPALSAQMLSFTLVFKADAPITLLVDPSAAPTQTVRAETSERARLLRSALELAVFEGYANLTPMRISDEAEVSIDTFFCLFHDVEACLLAAVERLAQEVRETVSDPALTSGAEWPYAVRRALDALLRYFAARPVNAQTIATGVFAFGQRAVDLGAQLAGEVADRLTAGAPMKPRTELAKEGIEGAIWHTIYSLTARGETASLPSLSDHLAYVVLTPYLGPEEASRLVAAARAPHAA